MKKVIALMMVAGILTGVAFSTEESEKEVKRIKKDDVAPFQKNLQQRPVKPDSSERRKRPARTPEERLQLMLSRQTEVHEKEMGGLKKAIDELKAIKKIAEEEGATRTVEALQKMIDVKNAEYKTKTEQFSRQQKERIEQNRQRSRESVQKRPEKRPVPVKEESDK